MKLKNAPKEMRRSAYRDFVEYLDSGQIKEFIEGYIKSNTLLTPEAVIGLALNQAILNKDVELVDKILSKCGKYDKVKVLTTLDQSSHTPLSNSLNSGAKRSGISNIVGKHIANLPDKGTKINLEGVELLNIRLIAEISNFYLTDIDDMTIEDNIEFLKQNYLSHIYTPESIEFLSYTFDVKFNRSEYLKEFESNITSTSTSSNSRT